MFLRSGDEVVDDLGRVIFVCNVTGEYDIKYDIKLDGDFHAWKYIVRHGTVNRPQDNPETNQQVVTHYIPAEAMDSGENGSQGIFGTHAGTRISIHGLDRLRERIELFRQGMESVYTNVSKATGNMHGFIEVIAELEKQRKGQERYEKRYRNRGVHIARRNAGKKP